MLTDEPALGKSEHTEDGPISRYRGSKRARNRCQPQGVVSAKGVKALLR